MLAFSIAVAPFVFVMPDEFKEFGKEVGHAGVMIVNHLFLIQQGYFDRAADTKVLLHLWSLAVEEQFYLAAPLILAGLWFVRRCGAAGAVEPTGLVGRGRALSRLRWPVASISPASTAAATTPST